jgi:hypothetical protein
VLYRDEIPINYRCGPNSRLILRCFRQHKSPGELGRSVRVSVYDKHRSYISYYSCDCVQYQYHVIIILLFLFPVHGESTRSIIRRVSKYFSPGLRPRVDPVYTYHIIYQSRSMILIQVPCRFHVDN